MDTIEAKELHEEISNILDDQEQKYFDENHDKIVELVATFAPDRFPAGDDWDDGDIADLVREYIHEHLQEDFNNFIFSQENNK